MGSVGSFSCWRVLLLWAQLYSILTASSGAVELRIELNNEGFLIGEPIVVTTKIVNTGSGAIRIYPSLNPGEGYLRFKVTSPDGTSEWYRPSTLIDVIYSGKGRELLPGQHCYGRWNLVSGCRRGHYTAPTPGKYKLQAFYRSPIGHEEVFRGKLESNVVELQVVQPTGNDADALDLFRESNRFTQFGEAGDIYPYGAKNALEQLVTLYPNSVYAKYARYYIAMTYVTGIWDQPCTTTGATVTHHWDRALEHFETLVENHRDFAYAEETQFFMGKCYYKLGKTDKARTTLRDFLSKYPESPLLKHAKEILSDIGRP